MTAIPDYPKKIRDLFDFRYWTVEYNKDENPRFTFYSRRERIDRNRKIVSIMNEPWEDDSRASRWERIMDMPRCIINGIVSEIVNEIDGYRNWKDGDTRDITVAVLKSDPTKWGLAIYKPDDYIIETEIVPDGFFVIGNRGRGEIRTPVTRAIETKKRQNFSKKLGQAWAIKDYEMKRREVIYLCCKEHCPFSCFNTLGEWNNTVLNVGVEPVFYRERTVVKLDHDAPKGMNRTCMYQQGRSCMYDEWKETRQM